MIPQQIQDWLFLARSKMNVGHCWRRYSFPADMPPDLPSPKAGTTHVIPFNDPHVLYMVCRKLNAFTRRDEYLEWVQGLPMCLSLPWEWWKDQEWANLSWCSRITSSFIPQVQGSTWNILSLSFRSSESIGCMPNSPHASLAYVKYYGWDIQAVRMASGQILPRSKSEQNGHS